MQLLLLLSNTLQKNNINPTALIIFVILLTLGMVAISFFNKDKNNVKNKSKNESPDVIIYFLFALLIVSVSTVVGPWFFSWLNFNDDDYQATSCLVTSFVAVMISYFGANVSKARNTKTDIQEKETVEDLEEEVGTLKEKNEALKQEIDRIKKLIFPP